MQLVHAAADVTESIGGNLWLQIWQIDPADGDIVPIAASILDQAAFVDEFLDLHYTCDSCG